MNLSLANWKAINHGQKSANKQIGKSRFYDKTVIESNSLRHSEDKTRLITVTLQAWVGKTT